MNFKDKLNEYKENKTRILINGLGEGTTKGVIIDVKDDYVEYELVDVQIEKKTNKTKTTTEIQYIPINQISSLSTGETEKTTSSNLLEGV